MSAELKKSIVQVFIDKIEALENENRNLRNKIRQTEADMTICQSQRDAFKSLYQQQVDKNMTVTEQLNNQASLVKGYQHSVEALQSSLEIEFVRYREEIVNLQRIIDVQMNNVEEAKLDTCGQRHDVHKK